jgi:hypothetical protein
MHIARTLSLALCSLFLVSCSTSSPEKEFQPLFPTDGVPAGWRVSDWSDVSKPPAQAGTTWKVEQGVLHGSNPRGTWLISEREYGDFILAFDWKLGERGNSGCGLRFPDSGDPAFDGLELQMVDPRYFPADMTVMADELTGGLYRAIAPSAQVYRPTEWNSYEITCKGSKIKVVLNGVTVQNVDLATQTKKPTRHDGTIASPLKDRPLRGRIGFQELSRGGGHVEIRNARIKILD